jgi:hypothetical protein
MRKVSLLIDNDIVIKLAQMDAFVDGISAIGASTKEVGSLGTMLRFMGKSSEANRRRLTVSEQEANRLHQVLAAIIEVEPSIDEQRLAAALMKAIIEAQLDMDEGEVVLFAIGAIRKEVEVATGDKRALRELPHLARMNPVIGALRKRLICFEQIIKRLCQSKGLPRVRTAVLIARHADKTITVAYDMLESKGTAAFVTGMDLVVKERIGNFAPNWLKAV